MLAVVYENKSSKVGGFSLLFRPLPLAFADGFVTSVTIELLIGIPECCWETPHNCTENFQLVGLDQAQEPFFFYVAGLILQRKGSYGPVLPTHTSSLWQGGQAAVFTPDVMTYPSLSQ